MTIMMRITAVAMTTMMTLALLLTRLSLVEAWGGVRGRVKAIIMVFDRSAYSPSRPEIGGGANPKKDEWLRGGKEQEQPEGWMSEG